MKNVPLYMFENLCRESILFWLPYRIGQIRCWAIFKWCLEYNSVGTETPEMINHIAFTAKPNIFVVYSSLLFQPHASLAETMNWMGQILRILLATNICQTLFTQSTYSNEEINRIYTFSLRKNENVSVFSFLVRMLWMLSAIVKTWNLLL